MWIDSIAIPWRIIQQIKTGEANILNPQGISWIWDQPSTGDLFTWSISSPPHLWFVKPRGWMGFRAILPPFYLTVPPCLKVPQAE